MKYVNVKTGAVIETASVISGENWEELQTEPFEEDAGSEKTSRTKRSKKAGDA